jgi:hypothetical protein
MSDFDVEEYEENLKGAKAYRLLPQKLMMKRFEDCGRDVYTFWNTIEWDSEWLKHDTPEEKLRKDVKREFERHPLKNWIKKPKELIEF